MREIFILLVMGYKIPAEKLVVSALSRALKRVRIINSQRSLREFVSKELAKVDPAYKISGKRARLVAIKSGKAGIELHAKEGKKIDRLDKCPVCFSKVRPIKNKTLYDWEITVGYKCKVCGYSTGMKLKMPKRYVFHKK